MADDPSIILDIEPDWSAEPAVSYSFLTAIQQTQLLVEQRRPLLPEVVRSAGYRFVEKDEKSQRLIATLIAAKG